MFPAVVFFTGVAGMGVGAWMIFAPHDRPSSDEFDETDWKTNGYIVGGIGAVVAITGGAWFLATKSSSGPTVGVTTTGDATIGWTGRF